MTFSGEFASYGLDWIFSVVSIFVHGLIEEVSFYVVEKRSIDDVEARFIIHCVMPPSALTAKKDAILSLIYTIALNERIFKMQVVNGALKSLSKLDSYIYILSFKSS